MFIRFDTIHERDRHTDTHTPHDGIRCAYAYSIARQKYEIEKLCKSPLVRADRLLRGGCVARTAAAYVKYIIISRLTSHRHIASDKSR